MTGRVEALTALPLPEASGGKVDVLVSEWMGELHGGCLVQCAVTDVGRQNVGKENHSRRTWVVVRIPGRVPKGCMEVCEV